jgi:hypothetical protein
MTLEVVTIVVKGDKLDLCTVFWKLSNLSSPWQLPSGAASCLLAQPGQLHAGSCFM